MRIIAMDGMAYLRMVCCAGAGWFAVLLPTGFWFALFITSLLLCFWFGLGLILHHFELLT